MSKLYHTLDIAGRTVLITGASAGIGEACSWRFAEAGCKLVLLARRTDRLVALKEAIQKEFHVPVHIVSLDVRDIKAVEALPQHLPPDFNEVDILVNNAGLALGTASVQDNNMEDIATMLQTNVTSVIAFTKVFVQGMIKRNQGHLINISSIAGQEAYGGGTGYCATKHALQAFTDAARHDLIGNNIRVTSISPGAVKTEFSIVRFKGNTEQADAVYKGIDPLVAADIADNVIYAATRPRHVQIADILVFATYQASAKGIARVLST